MKSTLSREFYIPKGYVEFKPELGDYPKEMFACFVSLEKNIAMFFIGKQSKPAWHFRFLSEEKMKEKIFSSIKSLMARHERMVERREKRKEPTTLEVGQILYSTWGWEQTNVDWYQILKVVSPHMVELREIKGTRDTSGMPYDQYKSLPVKGEFVERAEVLRKKVDSSNIVNISSFQSAYPWDGRSISGSCYA